MSFFKTDSINYSFIVSKVGELIEDNDLHKIRSHMNYLLEEISYARYQWETLLDMEDWEGASKLLHREKLIIQQMELANDESALLKIQKRDPEFQASDLKTFYAELIELFKQLERLIGSAD